MLSGQVSYFLHFTGPSAAVDTACASGLSAVAMGEMNLRYGWDGAVAVGALSLYDMWSYTLACLPGAMLSGRCQPFSMKANGYGRAEGVGAVAMRHLGADLAVPPLAELRGIAQNSDGASVTPITRPSPSQQLECMRMVWRSEAADCGAVECHGTGTPVGDPTEVNSVGDMVSQRVCIGGVKGNINHTESTAGIAGLIKMVNVVQQQTMCPHGAGHWSPELSILSTKQKEHLILSTECQQLREGARAAGVNCFGFSGTNVHARIYPVDVVYWTPASRSRIRMEYSCNTRSTELTLFLLRSRSCGCGTEVAQIPVKLAQCCGFQDQAVLVSMPLQGNGFPSVGGNQALPCLVQFSAATQSGLAESMAEVKAKASKLDADGLAQIAWQSQQHCHDVRGASGGAGPDLRHRRAIVARSHEDLEKQLDDCQGPDPAAKPVVVLVCPGNGCQQAEMSTRLLAEFPAAREVLQKISEGSGEVDWLQLSSGQDRSAFGQQAQLFIYSLTTTHVLCKAGLRPDAVLGHSAGEVTCAYAAGALDINQTKELFLAKVGGPDEGEAGAMAVIRKSAEEVKEILQSFNATLPPDRVQEEIHLAADNSRKSCTVSGLPGSLEKVKALVDEEYQSEGVWVPLQVSRAHHHGRLCEKAAEAFQDRYRNGPSASDFCCDFFSTVHGRKIEASELTVDYWKRHTLQPVLFRQPCLALLRQYQATKRPIVFVELRRQNVPSILAAAEDLGMKDRIHVLVLSDPKVDVASGLPAAIAKLWEWGLPLDVSSVFPHVLPQHFPPELRYLPRPHFCRQPAFQKQDALCEAEQKDASQAVSVKPPEPRASGPEADACSKCAAAASPGVEKHWMDFKTDPILYQHLFKGNYLVPGAVFLKDLIEAGHGSFEYRFLQPCFVQGGSACVCYRSNDEGHFYVKSSDLTVHLAEGALDPDCDSRHPEEWKQLLQQLRSQSCREVQVQATELGRLLEQGGLHFGEDLAIQGRVRVQEHGQDGSCFGLSTVQCVGGLCPSDPHASSGAVLVDQAIQTCLGLCLWQLPPGAADHGAFPTMVEKFTVYHPAMFSRYRRLVLVVEAKPFLQSTICGSFALFAGDGTLVAEGHNVRGKLMGSNALPPERLTWQVKPTPLPRAASALPTGSGRKALVLYTEQSVMTKVLEKDLWPVQDMILVPLAQGSQGEGLILRVAKELQRAGVKPEELQWVIFETQGIDPQQEHLTPAVVQVLYDQLREQADSFCKLLRWANRNKRVHFLVITKNSPQFADFTELSEARTDLRGSGRREVGQGMFVGMVKSLVNEGVDVHCFELADESDKTVATLVKEMQSPRDDCTELLIRDGQPHRLELLPLSVSYDRLRGTNPVRKDGVYLLTGGAKGNSFSAVKVRVLARMGASKLVVVGRSPADEAFRALMSEMQHCGTEVIPVQADVTDQAALGEALNKAGILDKDVRGIFHGAASFDGDKLFQNVSDEDFERTLKPKLKGSLDLLGLAQKREWELDLVVYDSSVVVALGNLGQVAYGGANGFQADLGCWQALARWNGTCQVINWTVLANVGIMHDQKRLQKQLEETRGFAAINVATIDLMFEAALRSGLPMLTVATFDREKLPTLSLASKPPVAGRFRTVMARYGLEEPGTPSAAHEPSAEDEKVPVRAASTREAIPAGASAEAPLAEVPVAVNPSAAGSAVCGAGARPTTSGGPLSEGMLRIFRKDLPTLDVEASLLDQGLDSALAIDFQQQLKNIGAEVQLDQLLADQPVSVLLTALQVDRID
ncbi:FUB1 [Symbiodinium sp. CCMP2456]|nr:FUB1 [Symbiodinium sp. CCMP2456]